MTIRVSAPLGTSSITLETGALARQADGAVVVTQGATVVLVTAVGAPSVREGIDFFPLTCDYREKTYAAGKIPGGFFKREGRPTEKEILSARLMDRPIRPLFPEGLFHEIQVMAAVLSSDGEYDPDVLAGLGASAALRISSIPFADTLGMVRVGCVNGQFIPNPTYEQLKQSTLDLVVAGTAKGIVMLEAGLKEVPEQQLMEAIRFGDEQVRGLIRLQEDFVARAGKPKSTAFEVRAVPAEVLKKVRAIAEPAFKQINTPKTKDERYTAVAALQKSVLETLAADETIKPADVAEAFHQVEWETTRRAILEGKRRTDGRDFTSLREINCQVGVLPRTHGSGLFTRGETQSLAVTTLGTSDDEQLVEALEGESYKRFMLHYNFPPFSVGEVRRLSGPGRREIGHGALAERALEPLVPSKDEFPYTIRVVSDILESNGSSSMATVCSASMSLMDAGVPIRAAVAGVAMGLVQMDGQAAVLTDIAGVEDHLGDMDFKVAGTKLGTTAVQVDVKAREGLSLDLVDKILKQAHPARMSVLEKMTAAVERPRAEISMYAPRITVIKINTEKIRDVIGPGGRVIRKIIEETGATIDVEDDGTISVASSDAAKSAKAVEIIRNITEDVEVGKIYQGKVKRIMNFGAFCEILPGKEGLVHVSELDDKYVNKVEDVVKLGDEFPVKVIEIDEQGRVNLSRKRAMPTYKEGERGRRPAAGAGRGPWAATRTRARPAPGTVAPQGPRGKRMAVGGRRSVALTGQWTTRATAIFLAALGLFITLTLLTYDPADVPVLTSHPQRPTANLGGTLGAWIGFLGRGGFGWASLLLPALCFLWGVRLWRGHVHELHSTSLTLAILCVLASVGTLFALPMGTESGRTAAGGIVGFLLARSGTYYLGGVGTFLAALVAGLLGWLVVSGQSLRDVSLRRWRQALDALPRVWPWGRRDAIAEMPGARLAARTAVLEPPATRPQGAESEPVEEETAPAPPRIRLKPTISTKPKILPTPPRRQAPGGFQLPPLDLLATPPPLSARQVTDDLQAIARVLEQTLSEFGLEAKVVNVDRGPTITRYELTPAPGVKINKITGLSDDLALALRAVSCHVIAPIPGKGTVGIDVPNSSTSTVYLKEVITAHEFTGNTSPIALPIGKDVSGKPLVIDLRECPHLLIAGATGSGKTVCLNSLLIGMLMHASPEQVRFLMIDPKMVEMAMFNDIPHLAGPVLTTAKKASVALHWAVKEMERRYQLFAAAGVRNIESYNRRAIATRQVPRQPEPAAEGEEGGMPAQDEGPLPYIVIVVDELADLMMIAAQDVEGAIARLAQLSRAVGLHMILATQRPSVDIITGVIKANFPARIAFQVASKVDSRTILDMNGADKLIGRGDLLFLKPGSAKPIRAQGAFVTDGEIEAVTSHLKAQQGPSFDPYFVEHAEQRENSIDGEKDEMYEQAKELVINTGQASTSLLQRRLRLGYGRAARILDLMEQEGIVGPPQGSRPREVLVSRAAMQKEAMGQ